MFWKASLITWWCLRFPASPVITNMGASLQQRLFSKHQPPRNRFYLSEHFLYLLLDVGGKYSEAQLNTVGVQTWFLTSEAEQKKTTISVEVFCRVPAHHLMCKGGCFCQPFQETCKHLMFVPNLHVHTPIHSCAIWLGPDFRYNPQRETSISQSTYSITCLQETFFSPCWLLRESFDSLCRVLSA